MSAKNLDNHNRWRSKTIAFRVSPEENEQIEIAVRLSGLTKQDYITRRLLDRAVVVQGNPRVYKALRDQLAAVLGELRRIEAGGDVGDELLATIDLISVTLGGMKEVEIGISNSSYVEITSGLAEGDVVYYQEKKTSSSSGFSFPGGSSDDSSGFPGGGMFPGGGGFPGGNPGGFPSRSESNGGN